MFWIILVSLGFGVLAQSWWVGFVTLICSIIFLRKQETGTPLA